METGFFAGLNFVLSGAHLNSDLCMKRHPLYYGIQYVHKGPVYLSVNDGPVYSLDGPVVFLTSPESLFAYGSPPGTHREHYHICVNGERVKRYLESGLFPLASEQKLPYCKILSPDRFLAEMLELILLIRNGGKQEFAVCRYEHLLLSILHQTPEKCEGGFYQQELESLTQKILKNPELEWDFCGIAARLNISEKHFLRLFRSAYGVPPRRFLLQQRILKACTLLALKRDPIKAIADECGFPNPFYFSRLFKKYMLMTPELYRRTH